MTTEDGQEHSSVKTTKVNEDDVELTFVHRGPTWLSLDNLHPLPGSTGVCVLNVLFQGAVDVSCIRFKNYYVSTITIKYKTLEDDALKTKSVKSTDCLNIEIDGTAWNNVPWKTFLNRRKLMPDADYEECSQDYFTISGKGVNGHNLMSVTGMIIILRQPSYRWKTFAIRDLQFYGKSCRRSVLMTGSMITAAS